MAKKARDLDTPFSTGEKVQTLVPVGDIAEGTRGKVRLSNGLGSWRRYWVRFDGGLVRGQISHDQLVRPDQIDLWRQREAERAEAARQSEKEATESPAATEQGGGGSGGTASRVPAHLLARSKGAKNRRTDPDTTTTDDTTTADDVTSKIPAHLLARSKGAKNRKKEG
jgi:hypothetical protein